MEDEDKKLISDDGNNIESEMDDHLDHENQSSGSAQVDNAIDDSKEVISSSVTSKNDLDGDKKLNSTTGAKLICELCKKTFLYSSRLKAHTRVHSGEKPFSCDICGQSYSQKSHLNVHKRFHTGKKPFRCDICGKAFNRNSLLTLHKRVHTGEKPFRCEVCGKAFSQKNSLINHIRIHTGEKPFRCEVCGKAFTRLAHLNYHKRSNSHSVV